MKKQLALRIGFIIALLVFVSIKQTPGQSVTAKVPIGTGSYAVAVNPNTNRIYIMQWRLSANDPHGYLNCLITVDGNTNAVIHTICLAQPIESEEWAYSVAVNPVTNRIYFGTDKRLLVIDGGTNAVIAEIPDVYAYTIAVNPLTNRIYLKGAIHVWGVIIDGTTNQIIGQLSTNPGLDPQGLASLAINPSLGRLYVRNFGVETGQTAAWVFDLSTNTLLDEARYGLPTTGGFMEWGGLDVNIKTNRIYVNDYLDTWGIAVFEDHGGTQIDDGPITIITLHGAQTDLVVNSNSNHIYALGVKEGDFGLSPTVWCVDGQTDTVTGTVAIGTELGTRWWEEMRGIAVNTLTNRVYAANYEDGNLYVIGGEASVTSTGSNIAVQASGATLTYDNVVTAGTTVVEPITDPSQAGEIPGGFAISDTLAFEVSTTATFSGPVTSCFDIPNVNTGSEFLALRVLHRELNPATSQYELVDRTISHDFANRKICATTTSFSPFYVAKVGNKVRTLFDQSRAYRAGSTIAVKVRMLDTNDQNISGLTLPLTVRGLRRIGSTTSSTVTDAGNSNSDNEFRYESGAGRYIYNLQTTGLAAGKYVLSFYAGADRSLFYNLEFQVR